MQNNTPVLNLSAELRIANTAAILAHRYGSVTQRAHACAPSRQALYRDVPKVLRAVDGQDYRQQLRTLQDDNQALRQHVAQLEGQLAPVVPFDSEPQAQFASTAPAEGVSLPVARRLRTVLRREDAPSVATLGRMTQAAARKATALLDVLDSASRAKASQVAADEIFFGQKPCLMVVEQHSLCWLSGRLTQQRTGAEWAQELRHLPHLRQTTQDGGTALAKGLDLVNQERQQQGQTLIVAQDDHCHVQREGHQVLRRLQGRVRQPMAQAEAADRKAAQKSASDRRWPWSGGRGEGLAAGRAVDGRLRGGSRSVAGSPAGVAAVHPAGDIEHAGASRGGAGAQLPRLSDPAWAKVRRALARPQVLAFRDAAAAGVAALPLPAAVRDTAVRVEGLRRQPAAVRGAGAPAAALRGVLLVAGVVLSLSGEAGSQAVGMVHGVLAGV